MQFLSNSGDNNIQCSHIKPFANKKLGRCQSSCELSTIANSCWVSIFGNIILSQLPKAITLFFLSRYEFLRTTATELHDGGRHLMMKQRGFQLINPTEKWFPGLMKLREKYVSHAWYLGKIPSFTVQKDFVMKSDDKDHNVQLVIQVCAVSLLHRLFTNRSIVVTIINSSIAMWYFVCWTLKQGLIDDIILVLPNIESIPVVSTFKGEPYSQDYADRIIAALKSVSSDNVEHAMNNSL